MQRGLLTGLLLLLALPGAARGGMYFPPPPDVKPVWSPDATAVVYYRWYGGLHVVNPGGGSDRLLSGLPESPYFAFSRNWHWIAFTVYQGTPNAADVEVMRPDGSERRAVAANATAGHDPAFTPDGKRVAYTGAGGIWTAPIEGGAPTLVAPGGSDPVWRPDDGRLIAFTLGGPANPRVAVAAFDGSDTWRISETFYGDVPAAGPSWSPDGTRLAYFVLKPTPRIAVYDFPAEKGTAFPVRYASELRWSPDGRRILFTSASGLAELDVKTGAIHTVVERATDGAWSPDGARIAYSATGECGDRAGIYVDERRLTNDCRVLGTNGPDRLTSSNVLYEIVEGFGGDDTLVGRGAAYVGDELDGGDGNDVLSGGFWSDKLDGGRGNDTIRGGPNGDIVTGGTGRDRLYGEGGRDTILARDGERDVVDCGTNTAANTSSENDKAYIDRLDVVRGCEHVYRSR